MYTKKAQSKNSLTYYIHRQQGFIVRFTAPKPRRPFKMTPRNTNTTKRNTKTEPLSCLILNFARALQNITFKKVQLL